MKWMRYHEAIQRGSADFPLGYYDLNRFHTRYEMPYHWHEECEILIVRTGSFQLTVDKETVVLEAGDAVFIPVECLHGGTPNECTYECAVFDLRLLMKTADSCKRLLSGILHRQVSVQTVFRKGNPIADTILSPMFDSLRSQCTGWELVTLGCLFRFFGSVLPGGCPYSSNIPDTNGKKVLQLKKVFELIENDYASHLSLDHLAETVHMSPKYFCRFFKEATGRTPIDYLNYYRIEMACTALATTDKNVTEIAMDIGFSNPNYFIRQFRKYKGTTPGRYQASMLEVK